MQNDRLCLMKNIESLQYLGRQCLAWQGKTDEESSFIQPLRLRAKDDNPIKEWFENKGDTYTSHDVQNEIIAIMVHQVIHSIVQLIRFQQFFTILYDIYTDISNKEQMSASTRLIANWLLTKILLVFLSHSQHCFRHYCLSNCYCMIAEDNAMIKPVNYLVKTEGCQRDTRSPANALATHCHGHTLSLSMKDATRNCKILSDTMDTLEEITQLIKNSPKHQNMLWKIEETLVEEDKDTASAHEIIMLCHTCWTVWSEMFPTSLRQLLSTAGEMASLLGWLKAELLDVKALWILLIFFFGLHFIEYVYCHTDNLSKDSI